MKRKRSGRIEPVPPIRGSGAERLRGVSMGGAYGTQGGPVEKRKMSGEELAAYRSTSRAARISKKRTGRS